MFLHVPFTLLGYVCNRLGLLTSDREKKLFENSNSVFLTIFLLSHDCSLERSRFALLTYLLTYLPCYVLGKLFTHVHCISMCVIVYIAEVLTLSPFNTISLCALHTYLLTYLLQRSKVKTSINWFMSHNFPDISW